MSSIKSTLRLLALAFSLAGTDAHAQVFDVKGVDVEPGKTTVESNNTVFDGFPANAERTRSSHELAFGYGFADWFKLGVKASFDKPLDESFQFSTAAIEGQATLKKFQGGLGIAWFTEVALAIDRDETNAVTFGPILQFGTEATQFLINPFFSQTFGRNREDGTEFSYAWALKQQIRDGCLWVSVQSRKCSRTCRSGIAPSQTWGSRCVARCWAWRGH